MAGRSYFFFQFLTMAQSATNIKLGDGIITYNSVDLGHTKGGVSINFTTEKREVTVDKYGVVPVRVFNNGTRVEVTVRLPELTLENLNMAIPTSALVTGATKDEINVGDDAGTEITGAVLVFTPDADADMAITIHKAIPMGDFELKFSNDEESYIEARFTGIIDESKSSGEKLMRIGLSD